MFRALAYMEGFYLNHLNLGLGICHRDIKP